MRRSTYGDFSDNQLGGDDILTGAEASAGITLTGTAEAGAQVAVELQGNTRFVTATAGGTWSADFESSEITSGTYTDSATVTVIDAALNSSTSTYTFDVDTEVSNFSRSTISTGADNVLTEAEAQLGLTVTGSVEAGSSVMVMFGAAGPYAASVSGGTWSLTIPTADIPPGEALATMTAPYSEVVDVDRVVTSFAPTGGPGTMAVDGFLNAEEFAHGLTLTGTGEAYSSVVIRLSNGAEQSVVVGSDGRWEAVFDSASLPSGEVTLGVAVTATDLAGNVSTFTDSLVIDTIAPPAPDVVGFSKNLIGVDGIRTVATEELAAQRSAGTADDSQRRIVALERKIATLLARETEEASVLRQTSANLRMFTEQYKLGRRPLMELVGMYETYARLERDHAALKYDRTLLRLQIAQLRGQLVDGRRM